jgi:hypothetical protein
MAALFRRKQKPSLQFADPTTMQNTFASNDDSNGIKNDLAGTGPGITSPGDTLQPLPDANITDLKPLDGFPGQFTNGQSMGAGDQTNGSVRFGVYDQNGKFLGTNETIYQNGIAANYGYSYGTKIDESGTGPGITQPANPIGTPNGTATVEPVDFDNKGTPPDISVKNDLAGTGPGITSPGDTTKSNLDAVGPVAVDNPKAPTANQVPLAPGFTAPFPETVPGAGLTDTNTVPLQPLPNADITNLRPLAGFPGQFTDGQAKGGDDGSNGSMMYGVFDQNGKFLGWNETVFQNGQTVTNYGYSYGTKVDGSGMGPQTVVPVGGQFSPPEITKAPDAIDRWVSNHPAQHNTKNDGYLNTMSLSATPDSGEAAPQELKKCQR